MSESFPFLIVGTKDAELDALRREMQGRELICVPDGLRAVACLKARAGAILAALLDGREIGEELEELIVYLKGAFPEVALAVLGTVSPEDQKRLRLLGASHFLERPVTPEGLGPLLRQRAGLRGRRAAEGDWSVRVDRGNWVEITVPSREEYVSRVQELIDLPEGRA